MKTTHSLLLIILALSMVFAIAPNTSGLAVNREKFFVDVVQGEYGDYDNDGADDDVKIIVKVNILKQNSGAAKYDLYCDLALPSGKEYSVWATVITTNYDHFICLYGYDCATEPGWYTVSLVGIYSGRHFAQSELVFDPPTGSGPGNPSWGMSLFW